MLQRPISPLRYGTLHKSHITLSDFESGTPNFGICILILKESGFPAGIPGFFVRSAKSPPPTSIVSGRDDAETSGEMDANLHAWCASPDSS